jgi:structural maintenance of chromosome 2
VIFFILKQVRAGSLQELVYKQGQAGVTRATVTVVFSNKDKNQSPVGYEAYDEIAVCRQVLNLMLLLTCTRSSEYHVKI